MPHLPHGFNFVPETGLWLSDNTVADATTTRHGLLPKLPGTTTTFLRGDGTFAVPPAGSGSLSAWVQDHPDTAPSSPHADDHEFLNGDTIGGTTLGSPATAPSIVDNALKIVGNTPGVSPSVVAVVWTAPSTPYVVTAKVRIRTRPNPYGVSGIILRSSASGRFKAVDIFKNAGDYATILASDPSYTSLTVRSSTGTQLAWPEPFAYVRISNDGTTGIYSISHTGFADDWQSTSEALTTHFTGGNLPDQFGLFVDSFSASVAAIAYFDWLRVT